MMAIRLSNVGSIGSGSVAKASDPALAGASIADYVADLESRMDGKILTVGEAIKAKEFLGDLDSQYRYVLKALDSYITDQDRLISKDGADITETS